MARYAAPLADLRFALYDVLDVENLFKRLPGFETATRDVVDAILDEASKIHRAGARAAQPDRRSGRLPFRRRDRERDNAGRFQQSLRAVRRERLGRSHGAAEFGGQAMPQVLGAAFKEMLDSANLSWGNYPLLSHGATEALVQHGEEWQREAFLKPIVEGRWTGTMCLTEPHCGTDLGLLKTKAAPSADGTLPHQRHEDLHHGRRARFHREHRASRACAPARCTGRRQRHFAVRRAEVQGRPRRQARRAQRARVRRDRAQDGHQGLGDLHDELRRRRRLAHRRAEQGPQCDVHDDEHRAARGRPAGTRADRARVPELARIRARAPADARAVGREVSGPACRSADRASGHPAHAVDAESVRRRLPAARALRVHAGRHRTSVRPMPTSASAPRRSFRS